MDLSDVLIVENTYAKWADHRMGLLAEVLKGRYMLTKSNEGLQRRDGT